MPECMYACKVKSSNSCFKYGYYWYHMLIRVSGGNQ